MGEVYRARDTKLDRDVALNDGRDRWPIWSPNGRELVFSSNRAGGDYALWTIRADGGGLARLSDPSVASGLAYPVFAPSGDRLFVGAMAGGQVFSLDLSGTTPAAATEIARVDATYFWPTSLSPDGGTLLGLLGREVLTQATYDLATESLTILESLPGNYSGSWLSDGRRTLFQTGPHTLVVYNIDTGAIRELGPWSFEIVSEIPFVSPDGRTIYVGGGEWAADSWMGGRKR
jgi:Tol biopolymer transport system component